jgi:predicted nucleic acid-binding protein
VTDIILDNTPLSHFARAGELPVLESITSGFRRIVPAQVMQEIIRGTPVHPALALVPSLPWIEIVELTEDDIIAFARYKAELGGGAEHNNGEAAVLAWTSVHGGTAIIDERAGTRAAKRDHIETHGTLWLIANAIKAGKLSEPEAIRMVDQLVATDMTLPVDGTRFLTWAHEEGLLPLPRHH